MVMISVSRVLHRTRAEGPGLRSAIWLQGCSIRCAGCINPHLFEETEPTTSTSQVIEGVLASGVEGVTFLGGEPFDQAVACAEIGAELRRHGLGVITFTGYQYEDLLTSTHGHQGLLAVTDLLVDGPYRQAEQETERALVGSSNQRFINLSDRYADYSATAEPNRIDIRVTSDGEIGVAGFLSTPRLRSLTRSPK